MRVVWKISWLALSLFGYHVHFFRKHNRPKIQRCEEREGNAEKKVWKAEGGWKKASGNWSGWKMRTRRKSGEKTEHKLSGQSQGKPRISERITLGEFLEIHVTKFMSIPRSPAALRLLRLRSLDSPPEKDSPFFRMRPSKFRSWLALSLLGYHFHLFHADHEWWMDCRRTSLVARALRDLGVPQSSQVAGIKLPGDCILKGRCVGELSFSPVNGRCALKIV